MSRLNTTTALIVLISGTPALADVTAPDVWDSMKAVYQSFGITTEATQSRTGNVVSMENLKFSGIFPFDLGSITITTTGFDLVENGDGTVAIEMPDNMPLAIALILPDDLFVTATLDYRITGYSALVSGDPGNITIEYSADSMVFSLSDLNIPDLPISNIDGTLTFTGLTGTNTIAKGEMLSFSESSTTDTIKLGGGFTNEENGTTYRMTEVWSETSDDIKLVLPALGIDFLGLSAQLRSGLSMQYDSISARITGGTITTLNGTIIGDQKASVSNTVTSMSISKNGFKLDGTSEKYILDYLIPELPIPIQATISATRAAIEFPLLSSPDDQNFVYTISFNGLILNEEIWALFDPTSGLPRDLATITIDLAGKVKLFKDLLDIEAMQQVIDEGIKFGELTSVTINNMDISAVGAKLSGTGVFTFDNSNLETYDGFPAPSGTATFNIAGLNALMDKLDAIGLLPDEARMGIGMGLSLMTVAGDGEDTLVSDIEITPDGQITANGKRLK